MRTETIALASLSEADLARWRELAAAVLEPNPFHEPEYVLPLAKGLGQTDDVALVVVRDGDGWHAALPVHRGRWHGIPLPSIASWRGHVLYGLLGTPLVRASDAGEATTQLIRAVARERGIAFAAFEDVADDGPFWALFQDALGPRAELLERFVRPAVRRRPAQTYIEESLNKKRRKELRRLQRRLAERLGEPTVTIDRAGEDESYARLVRLEAGGRKASGRTVLADDPAHATFFREMCRGFDELGRLQILCLEGGGETAAMQCNLIAGDTIFGVKIAYDQRWASLSPGVQLEIEGIRVFHEETTADLMDSCADPGNAMLNRVWPDRRSVATVVLPAAGPRGRLAAPTLRLARRVREWNRGR